MDDADALRERVQALEALALAGQHRIYCSGCKRKTPAYAVRHWRFLPRALYCWECGSLYETVTMRDSFRVRLTGYDRERARHRSSN